MTAELDKRLWPGADSEFSALVSTLNWAATALGDISTWPHNLRIAVDMVLSSPIAMILLWGPEHVIVYNSAYSEIAGDSHPRALGKTVAETWPEHRDWYQSVFQASFSGESPIYREHPLTVKRNGSAEEGWFDLFYSPVHDERMQVCGILCSAIDVTETVQRRRRHEQAEIALRKREHELSVIYDNVREIVFYLAVEGEDFRFLLANRAFYEATGLAGNQVIGRLVQQVIPEPSCTLVLRHYRAAIENRAAVSWEEITEYPSGRKTGLVTITPVFDAHGACTNLIGTVHDITRSKQIEAALRDETAILELLNRTGAAIASTLEIDKLLQLVTDAATRMAGATLGAFFYNTTGADGDALTLRALSGAPREAFEKFGEPRAAGLFGPTFQGTPVIRIDDVLSDPRYGQSAPHHGMPQGHLPIRSYLAVSVASRSGGVIGGLFFGHPAPAVFTERTEHLVLAVAAQAAVAIDNARLYESVQKSAEERDILLARERSARAEAERLSAMKDEFLAMLAHELRNPLAPISSAARYLDMAFRPEPRIAQLAGIITRQVDHMTRIVDDLLDMSRMTRGLVTIRKAPCDFDEILAHAVDQVRPLIEAKRQNLLVRNPRSAARIDADRTRLIQVFANILNNAAKYTPEGGEITLDVEAAAPDALRIAIRDNGPGMDEDLLRNVFDLFVQGKRTPDRSEGGLGLGLALVRKIVELHSGSVTAHSEGPGHGSMFTVILPALGKDGPPAQAATRESPPAGPVGGPAILVVDDNVDAADTLALLLQANGHRVTVKHTGEDALRQCAADAPQVMLIDIGMPGMDGYTLARKLRSLPQTANAVLIAVTGYGQAKDRRRAEAAGFTHHFVKPVDSARLLELLARDFRGQ
jgi:PAS domain S-box-containing protein